MNNDRLAICNHRRMKRINGAILLQLLRERGALSRIELAKEAGLDAKTVTNLVRDLLRKKIVEESGLVSTPGRPRAMLRLRNERLQAIALRLSERAVLGARIALDGKILVRRTVELGGRETRGSLAQKIGAVARSLLEVASVRSLGVGLVFPGILDDRRRVIVASAHLPPWEGAHLDQALKGVPQGLTYASNSTQAKALAEQWFGAARPLKTFLLIDMGVGIGCAVVSHGKLQTGESRIAGEIGHSIFDPRGARCSCGRRGCLETIASLDIIRRAISRSTHRPLSRLTVPVIARMLDEGNRPARAVARNAARAVGLVVANLVDVVNPSHVVISGETARLGPFFQQALDEALTEFAIPIFREKLRLAPTRLGDDAALLGAAVGVFQTVLDL